MTLGRLEQREADILRRMVRLHTHSWRLDQTLADCNEELEAIHDQILAVGVPAHVQIELRQSMAVARQMERLATAGGPPETKRRKRAAKGTAQDVAPKAGQGGVEHALRNIVSSAVGSPA